MAGALCAAVAIGDAQMRKPTAELSALTATSGARAGESARLALRVALPEGYHVQSNAPREKAFIPTLLTIDPPAGFDVTEIVYPPAIDLAQAGQSQPLAVFDREFTIGAVVTVPAKRDPGRRGGAGAPALPGLRRAIVLRTCDREHPVDAAHRASRHGRHAAAC